MISSFAEIALFHNNKHNNNNNNNNSKDSSSSNNNNKPKSNNSRTAAAAATTAKMMMQTTVDKQLLHALSSSSSSPLKQTTQPSPQRSFANKLRRIAGMKSPLKKQMQRNKNVQKQQQQQLVDNNNNNSNSNSNSSSCVPPMISLKASTTTCSAQMSAATTSAAAEIVTPLTPLQKRRQRKQEKQKLVQQLLLQQQQNQQQQPPQPPQQEQPQQQEQLQQEIMQLKLRLQQVQQLQHQILERQQTSITSSVDSNSSKDGPAQEKVLPQEIDSDSSSCTCNNESSSSEVSGITFFDYNSPVRCRSAASSSNKSASVTRTVGALQLHSQQKQQYKQEQPPKLPQRWNSNNNNTSSSNLYPCVTNNNDVIFNSSLSSHSDDSSMTSFIPEEERIDLLTQEEQQQLQRHEMLLAQESFHLLLPELDEEEEEELEQQQQQEDNDPHYNRTNSRKKSFMDLFRRNSSQQQQNNNFVYNDFEYDFSAALAQQQQQPPGYTSSEAPTVTTAPLSVTNTTVNNNNNSIKKSIQKNTQYTLKGQRCLFVNKTTMVTEEIRHHVAQLSITKYKLRRDMCQFSTTTTSTEESTNNNNNNMNSADHHHHHSFIAPLKAISKLIRGGERSRRNYLKNTNQSYTRAFAKQQFADLGGMDALVTIMWRDTSNEPLQEAVLHLMLALVNDDEDDGGNCTEDDDDSDGSSDDGDYYNDYYIEDEEEEAIFVGEKGHCCVEALLFVMQTLLANPTIQAKSCHILSCLAEANSHNSNVTDGSRIESDQEQVEYGTTRSAVDAILQAMETHSSGRSRSSSNCRDRESSSIKVLQWAVKALLSLCVSSHHAKVNKKALAHADSIVVHSGYAVVVANASGRKTTTVTTTGPAVLAKALGRPSHDSLTLAEQLCKLYWTLSSCEEVAMALSHNTANSHNAALSRFYSLGRKHSIARGSIPLMQAIFGSLHNLCKLTVNRQMIVLVEQQEQQQDGSFVRGLLQLCLSMISKHSSHPGLISQALGVLANLPWTPATALIAQSNAFTTIVLEAVLRHSGEAAVLEKGMQSLISIAQQSDDAKAWLLKREHYSQLAQLQIEHEYNVDFQVVNLPLLSQMMCISSPSRTISSSTSPSINNDDHPLTETLLLDCVEYICGIMVLHANSKAVQTAGCESLRSISCHCHLRQTSDIIAQSDVLSLVVGNMQKYPESREIQQSGCCLLWILSSSEQSCSAATAAGSSSSDKETTVSQYLDTLVSAVQGHIESKEVNEMACSAILCMIHNSATMQEHFVVHTKGALEALSCILVVHRTEVQLLEKVLGILSQLSYNPEIAGMVASSELVVSAVVDLVATTSCRISSSTTKKKQKKNSKRLLPLLVYGTALLRNILSSHPEHVDVASEAFNAIIQVKKVIVPKTTDNDDCTILSSSSYYDNEVAFQREASGLLWLASTVSESEKSKIMAVDAMLVEPSVVERCD